MIAETQIPPQLAAGDPLQRFAHERLAMGLMKMAIPALASVDMPASVTLAYDPGSLQPWQFGIAIGRELDADGSLIGFRVRVTPLAPAFMLAVCAHFSLAVEDGDGPDWTREAAALREHVLQFGAAYGAATRAYQTGDLAAAVDVLYSSLGLNAERLAIPAKFYDVCSHFVTNHEIAHAYSGQMTLALGLTSARDQRGFEHIADSLAAEWLYNFFIRSTPDDPDYRTIFGHPTHSAAIRSNVLTVYRAQLLVLLTLMLASAVNSDGRVSLAGGRNHPHTMMRHVTVVTHLATLVLSNQADHVTEAELDSLDGWLHQWTRLFLESGLIGEADLRALEAAVRFEDLQAARELIRRCRIESLYGLAQGIDILPNRRSV